LYAIGNEQGTQIAPTKLVEESDIILQLNGVGAKRVLPFQRVIMSGDERNSQLAICVNGGAGVLKESVTFEQQPKLLQLQ